MIIEFAEARKCPECKQDGAVANRRAVEGGTLVNMQCENEACVWYQTQWYVELNANGKVEVNEKAYLAATSERTIYKRPDPTFADMFEKVHGALGKQLEAERHGGEVPPQ